MNQSLISLTCVSFRERQVRVTIIGTLFRKKKSRKNQKMGGCSSKPPPIENVDASRDAAASNLTSSGTHATDGVQPTLSADSATGGSELYNLCNKAKGSSDEAWENVLSYLKSLSARKRTKAAKSKAMGTFTPLAAACCRQPSLAVVKALVEAAPEMVRDVGNFDNTILHMALDAVANEEVVLYLIEMGALENVDDDASAGASIGQKDDGVSMNMLENGHGKTPLVLALVNGYSRETIEAILEAHGSENAKTIIQHADLEASTPLHHALQANASLDVIQYIVEQGGDSIIEVKDSKNLTPFDVAQNNEDVPQAVKDFLGSKVSWQSIPWIATSVETKLRVPRTIEYGPGPTKSYRGHLQSGYGPEYWGITIEQLEIIYKHPMLTSLQEHDTSKDEDIVLVTSELTGMGTENGAGDDSVSKAASSSKAQAASYSVKPPTMSCPSVRTVVEKIIEPATSETGLGYALTLNQDEPLEATTVVSHAWDMPLDELIDTLKDSGKEGPFWISAFSMYQNEEEEEDLVSTAMSAIANSVVSGGNVMSGNDFQYGPFCTAMKQVEDMVSILSASCDYYSRLW